MLEEFLSRQEFTYLTIFLWPYIYYLFKDENYKALALSFAALQLVSFSYVLGNCSAYSIYICFLLDLLPTTLFYAITYFASRSDLLKK